VRGKPVHVAFDGGQMTSDTRILLLAAIEQRLGITERSSACCRWSLPKALARSAGAPWAPRSLAA